MNPHQKNKIDIASLSADEQRLFRLYGKLPNKKDLLQNKLKERKYFDSGDYALSKAGKASDSGVTTIGTEHPQAENIPHLSATSPPNSASSPSSGIPGLSNNNNHHHSNNSISMMGGGGFAGDRDSHFLPGAGGHRGSIQGMHGGSVGILGGQSRSPVRESSYLARTASVSEIDEEATGGERKDQISEADDRRNLDELSVGAPLVKDGLPIRS